MKRLSGIYILYFPTDDGMYYIGKSVNITRRYYDHTYSLINNIHHNYKLQTLYNKYKVLPEESILELETDYTVLNAKEIVWISIFNSFNDGMNLTKGGDSIGQGELHPMSLYSIDTYTDILYELAYGEGNMRSISEELHVSYSVVKNIASATNHTYLEQLFPNTYQDMLNKLGTRGTGKYSKQLCISIVIELANTELTMEQISLKLDVPISLVKGVSSGEYHKDICITNPIEYEKMMSKKGTRYCGPKDGGTYPRIVSPEGGSI